LGHIIRTNNYIGSMNIFTDVGNVHSLRLLASCYATNTEIDLKIVDKKNYTNFSVPGLANRPLPVLQVEPEKFIFSHNSATRYVFARAARDAQCNAEVGKVDELLEWDSTQLQPNTFALLGSRVLQRKDTSSVDSLSGVLSSLNDLLSDKAYLVGGGLSAADVVVWGTLYGIMQLEDVLKTVANKYSNINRWFAQLSATEPFQKAAQNVVGTQGVAAFKPFFERYSVASVSRGSTEKVAAASGEDSEELTSQQIEDAIKGWEKGLSSEKPKERIHPILPKDGVRNIMINSALPYVNNVPHLGNIIGCVLSADVYSRFCRLRNYNSLFICGTDEYGTATETKALAEGLTPQQICDKYNKIHSEIYQWFQIDFDYFGRTTTDKQTQIAQDIFWKIQKNGHFIEDDVEQLQCTKCNKFLADRFVEGICPVCKYPDARGDQCDGCGKLINAVELIDPKCKVCSNSPIIKTSRHIFLDLPAIEPQLRDWLKIMDAENWTNNAKNITRGWLADGLKPRCVTRDLKWGTPVPLQGFTDKVFYVWFDAPIGYISITANYTGEWEKWWKNPDNVRYVQFMAKDNVPFHSVVFPSSLIACKDGYTMVTELNATEYLNYEDDKFSKSRGVGVFGDHAESTGIPSDIFRFYLLFVRPEKSDSSFQWGDLATVNNSELLNNLGNFINRGLMFLKNAFNYTMPELELKEEEYKLIATVNNNLKMYTELLEKNKIRDALAKILNISRAGNVYIQNNQPWVLAKGNEEERKRAGTVVGLSANMAALLSVMIQPYMPDISAQVQKQLMMSSDLLIIPETFSQMLPTGHKIGTPYPLFKKIEPAMAEELKKRFAGTRDESKAKGKENSKPAPQNGAAEAPSTNGVTPADPAKIAELEALVAAQGDVVRKAKTEKLSKDVIGAEVAKLLDLKGQLSLAQGIDPTAAAQKGKSKKKKK